MMGFSSKIKPWLSIEQMYEWLNSAPDENRRKRRLAIWLTHTGQMNAKEVASFLGLSTQTVWLWIRKYNKHGPDALDGPGRGGRRWAFLTEQQERDLLKPFIKALENGKRVKAADVKKAVEQKLGKKVSLIYVYKLLERNGWTSVIAQSHSEEEVKESTSKFQDVIHPWKRKQ